MKKLLLVIAVTILTVSFGLKSYASEGWKQDNTGWWYENTNGGYTKNGWQLINGTWYYFEDSGYMKTGWLYLGSDWYFLREDGAMHTGWYLYKDNWYFFNGSGAMHRGWLEYNSKWYYLHSTGPMAYSTTIDGYAIDAFGVWLSSNNAGSGGDQQVNSKYPLQLTYNNSRSYEDIDKLAEQFYSQYNSDLNIMCNEINKIRNQLGLGEVVLDKDMTLAAIARSIHMGSFSYLSHTYNNIDQPLFISERYGFSYSGEIIGYKSNTYSPESLIIQIKDSKDHYKILRAVSQKKVGIGIAPSNNDGIYLTVLFSN